MLAIIAVELTDQAWLLYRRISDIRQENELSAYQTKRLVLLTDKAYKRYQRRIKKEHYLYDVDYE